MALVVGYALLTAAVNAVAAPPRGRSRWRCSPDGLPRGLPRHVQQVSSRAPRSGRTVTVPVRQGRRPKREKPRRMHGRHVLNRYEDGMEKCIGCELCAGVCPARCIYVRGADNPPDDPVRPASATASSTRSTTCGASTATSASRPAPPRPSPRSKLFEFSFTNRHDAIYTKAELVVDDDGQPQQLPWEDWRDPTRTPHTSAWMRATAPSRRGRLRGHGRLVGRARLRRAAAGAGPGGRGADGARRARSRARRPTTHDDRDDHGGGHH